MGELLRRSLRRQRRRVEAAMAGGGAASTTSPPVSLPLSSFSPFGPLSSLSLSLNLSPLMCLRSSPFLLQIWVPVKTAANGIDWVARRRRWRWPGGSFSSCSRAPAVFFSPSVHSHVSLTCLLSSAVPFLQLHYKEQPSLFTQLIPASKLISKSFVSDFPLQ